MADVFISYAREDKDRITPIVDSLRLLSVSIWYDEKDIPAGFEWSEAIENALIEARAVIVCWSKESVRSKPVRKRSSLCAERR